MHQDWEIVPVGSLKRSRATTCSRWKLIRLRLPCAARERCSPSGSSLALSFFPQLLLKSIRRVPASSQLESIVELFNYARQSAHQSCHRQDIENAIDMDRSLMIPPARWNEIEKAKHSYSRWTQRSVVAACFEQSARAHDQERQGSTIIVDVTIGPSKG